MGNTKCGGCSNVNSGVSKSELTTFLAVAYHIVKEEKGQACGPRPWLQP